METKPDLEALERLLEQHYNELTTTRSLLEHHRSESAKLQNRMLQLQEMTTGLNAFIRGLRSLND